MRYLFALLVFVLPQVATAQLSITEYPSAQRAALKSFLADKPTYRFMAETWFERDTLRAARNDWGFGKKFKPYYRAGDFNGDGLPDFAVILFSGKDSSDPKAAMHVVIFNGAKGGGYRAAHVEHEQFSTAFFLHQAKETLYAGIMETDSAVCFRSAGNAYVAKPCGD